MPDVNMCVCVRMTQLVTSCHLFSILKHTLSKIPILFLFKSLPHTFPHAIPICVPPNFYTFIYSTLS